MIIPDHVRITTRSSNPAGSFGFNIVSSAIFHPESIGATSKSVAQLEPCQTTGFTTESLQSTYKLAILILFLMNRNTTIEFSTSDYPRIHLVHDYFMWWGISTTISFRFKGLESPQSIVVGHNPMEIEQDNLAIPNFLIKVHHNIMPYRRTDVNLAAMGASKHYELFLIYNISVASLVAAHILIDFSDGSLGSSIWPRISMLAIWR